MRKCLIKISKSTARPFDEITRLEENIGAVDVELTPDDLQEIESGRIWKGLVTWPWVVKRI
jgi:hypothetical protein